MNGREQAQDGMLERLKELDARELELAAREAELHRNEAGMRRAEEERSRLLEVEEREALLEARERELLKQEAALHATEQTALASQDHLEKRRVRLDKIEASVAARLHEIDERESAITLREAQIEAEVDIRLDKVELRERALEDLESRLERKERDLASYVGTLQAQGRVLTPDDTDWWAKQLGKEPVS